MAKKTSRLQDHIGFWMSRITNEVHHAFVEKLKKLDISIPEWCVLISLYHEKETTPAQIAECIGIDRAAISRTVEKLVQRGFIKRKVGKDRRCTPLYLTEKVNVLIPKLALIADLNDLQFFNMLEKEEKKLLKKILLKIAINLNLKT